MDLFFDLDRTLWDHEAATRATLAELAEEHLPWHVDALTFAKQFQAINDHLWEVIQSEGYGPEYARKRRFSQWLERYGPDLSQKEHRELAAALEKDYLATMPDQGATYPGVIQSVTRWLKEGHRLHVITNGPLKAQQRKLNAIELLDVMQTLTCADEVGIYKPHRPIFAHALRVAGAKAEETWMMGDSLLRDVIGGHRAGMRTAWFTGSGALSGGLENPADITFESWLGLDISR